MFAWPPQPDGVKLDKVVKIIETNDTHPSGLSMVGDILAVPIGGFIQFYDCRDPLNPKRLKYALPLIDDHAESTGANAVAITKLPEPDGRFLLVTDTDKGAHFYFSGSDRTSFFKADGITEVDHIFHESIRTDVELPDEWIDGYWTEKCNGEAEPGPDQCLRHRVSGVQYAFLDKDYLQALRTEDSETAWPFKGDGPANSRLFQGMNFVNQTDRDGVHSLFLIGSANSHEETPRLCCFGDDELYLLELFSAEYDHESSRLVKKDLVTLMPPWLHLRGVAKAVKMTRSPGAKDGGGEKPSYKYEARNRYMTESGIYGDSYHVFSKRWQANFNAGAGAYVSPSGELLFYAASHFADGEVGRDANYYQHDRADDYRGNDFVKMAEFGNKYVATDWTALADGEDKPGYCGPKFREDQLGGPYKVLEGSDGLTLNGEVLFIEPWARMFERAEYSGISVMMDWRNQNEEDYDMFSDLDGEYGECRHKSFIEADGYQAYNGFNNCMSSFFWCGPEGSTLTFFETHEYMDRSISIAGTGRVEGRVLFSDGDTANPDYDEEWKWFNDKIGSAKIDWTPPSLNYGWTLTGAGGLLEDPDPPYLQVYTPGRGSSTNTVTLEVLGQTHTAQITVENVPPTIWGFRSQCRRFSLRDT